jgi:uncharacterized membrane protein
MASSALPFAPRLALRLFVDSPLLAAAWHCHRRPERSFFVRNRQFNVCARCTGIYAGLLTAPLWLPFHSVGMPLLLTAAALNFLDGGTQLLRLRTSNNRLRLVCGVLLAIGIVSAGAHLLLKAFNEH